VIITKCKDYEEILAQLDGKAAVFLIGCGECATTCKTGGEREVDKLSERLIVDGKVVTGTVVLDPACNLLEVKKLLRKQKSEIEAAHALLSLSCGCGTQSLTELIPDKKIISCNDSLFQGEITKLTLQGGYFEQKCSLCGECIISDTGGICPVTRCAKGLRNGPCGGSKRGKCEVDSERDCIWLKIYQRLNDIGETDKMKSIKTPRDYTKADHPKKHTL
jgi:ferredoxin